MDRLVANGVDLWAMGVPNSMTVVPEPVDHKNSGRNDMTAEMRRKIVSVKDQITIKLRPLTQTEAETVTKLVYAEFVTVSYLSPRYGQRTGIKFYAKIESPTLSLPMTIKGRRVDWAWKGAEVTLTEK